MDFKTQTLGAGALAALAGDALLVAVAGKTVPESLEPALAALLHGVIDDGEFALETGKFVVLHRPRGVKAARLVFAAAGDGSARALRRATAAAIAALKSGGTRRLVVALVGVAAPDDTHGEAVATAAAEAVYLYRHTKPSAPVPSRLSSVVFAVAKGQAAPVDAGLRRGAAIASGVELARECANRPGNHCTPSFLAQEARRLGRSHGLKVEVLGRPELEKLGMGSFLAVARGSDEPPRFIVARYQGAAARTAPVVLVGKGITFDSGGISIKPAAEMDEMKFDMGGAASVLGTLKAVAALKARVNLIGLIPSCENLPSARALKP
ncbi:MAG: leucyl aminopeptidase, partial [Burkholderiales bacterium]|nr:leucyl aminopeptidase [Burkholderiales bacterium]